jgi:Tfp pilus assembly protein PilO
MMMALQATPFPPQGPIPEIVLNGQRNDLVFAIVALLVVSLVVIKVLGPIARAWARKLEGKAAAPEIQAEVDQLREQIAEVEPLRQRVLELEERVEFAERLLAQRKDPDLLARGGQT